MSKEQIHTILIGRDEDKTVSIDAPGTYEIRLQGAGARAHVRGSVRLDGNAVAHICVLISHEAPHTYSDTLLKGIATDTAQLHFTGKIKVAEHCPDTNAFLTERILLLSDTAGAHAVPDLEILTDDVKCSHAASISHIPDEHLFYLMSRGLTRQAAQELIVEGFLA